MLYWQCDATASKRSTTIAIGLAHRRRGQHHPRSSRRGKKRSRLPDKKARKEERKRRRYHNCWTDTAMPYKRMYCSSAVVQAFPVHPIWRHTHHTVTVREHERHRGEGASNMSQTRDSKTRRYLQRRTVQTHTQTKRGRHVLLSQYVTSFKRRTARALFPHHGQRATRTR